MKYETRLPLVVRRYSSPPDLEVPKILAHMVAQREKALRYTLWKDIQKLGKCVKEKILYSFD